jgi:mono/diheme cytochrome c family protein
MKRIARLLFALTLAGGAASPARAQEGQGDLVAAGHDFALKVCAACHVVAADQTSPPLLKPPAPSFLALARHGNLSEASLRKLLSTPHGNLGRGAKMPNPQLVDFQIDKVVAYILSLKSGKDSGK